MIASASWHHVPPLSVPVDVDVTPSCTLDRFRTLRSASATSPSTLSRVCCWDYPPTWDQGSSKMLLQQQKRIFLCIHIDPFTRASSNSLFGSSSSPRGLEAAFPSLCLHWTCPSKRAIVSVVDMATPNRTAQRADEQQPLSPSHRGRSRTGARKLSGSRRCCRRKGEDDVPVCGCPRASPPPGPDTLLVVSSSTTHDFTGSSSTTRPLRPWPNATPVCDLEGSRESRRDAGPTYDSVDGRLRRLTRVVDVLSPPQTAHAWISSAQRVYVSAVFPCPVKVLIRLPCAPERGRKGGVPVLLAGARGDSSTFTYWEGPPPARAGRLGGKKVGLWFEDPEMVKALGTGDGSFELVSLIDDSPGGGGLDRLYQLRRSSASSPRRCGLAFLLRAAFVLSLVCLLGPPLVDGAAGWWRGYAASGGPSDLEAKGAAAHLHSNRTDNLRWRPDDSVEADNCIPGYRLDDSHELHCGLGDRSPITNATDGATKLCGGIPMTPGYCAQPKYGVWAAEPAAAPLPNRLGLQRTAPSPLCSSLPELLEGNWTGEDFDEDWRPGNCRLAPLSPFEWTRQRRDGGGGKRKKSCQTTIAMMGDSHIRNLFTATVAGFRGVRYFAEAHADGSVKESGLMYTYVFRLTRDGEASDLVGWKGEIKANRNASMLDECDCSEVARCLRVVMLWAPKFNDQLEYLDLVPKDSGPVRRVVRGPDGASAGRPRVAARNPPLPLGGNPAEKRGALIHDWMNATYPDRMAYLRQDQLSGGAGARQGWSWQGRPTHHFACGFNRVDVRNDAIGAAEPCTDVKDTMQVRALVTLLFEGLL
ncbi:hypothetical protein THAOC_06067 [Thalassiosira oceanica]|uniref:Uncharacterized protein n=1 Tax=Thalassiosira oceanica TaxID=159749 RepID=K0T3W9_THAOC|nr:hypothetical protein THAOC_06067 [Thalassiosira oceanica]|eukprot:EJK72405.1 hypothetical protein THAOC_06067 [Thalassiosira oceanica]